MVLTVAGQALYDRVRTARSGLDEAVKEANDLYLGKVGLVRAGTSPNYAEHFFADACAALLRQRPAAKMQVTVGLNDKLFAALRLGDLDFCISALKPAKDRNSSSSRCLPTTCGWWGARGIRCSRRRICALTIWPGNPGYLQAPRFSHPWAYRLWASLYSCRGNPAG